jgi:sporulation protein YlmC with PRC-barrel domain
MYDREGMKVGEVEAVVVNRPEPHVRFLLVSDGGALAIGDEQRLVPVEAVDRIEQGIVFLDEARRRVAEAPKYDPTLVDEPSYWEQMYGWYGYAPYWTTSEVA